MREPRREYHWNPDNYKSNFKKEDFRSKLYSGNWTTGLLSYMQKMAVERNGSVLKSMSCSIADKQEHFPKKLYKFFTMNENSINCLENQTVFMASPNMFNDPFDCSLHASSEEFQKKSLIDKIKQDDMIKSGILSEEAFNKILLSRCDIEYTFKRDSFSDVKFNFWREDNKKLYDICNDADKLFECKIDELKKSSIRICCFAELSVEQLESFNEMWAHYANNHQGFCVEYDFSNIDFQNYKTNYEPTNQDIALGGLIKCTYQSKPRILPKSLIYKKFNDLYMTKKENVSLEKDIIQSCLTKSSAWSYEHEWRMILDARYSKIFNNLISFQYISAVYLGVNMSESNKETVFRIADRNNFKVYEGKIESRSYSISFCEKNLQEYLKEKTFRQNIYLPRYHRETL